MGLQYHPRLGQVLLCTFPSSDVSLHDDALNGEMVKDRLVIVVNRRLAGRRDLVNVVPVSMSEPHPRQPWHVELPMACLPPSAVRARPGPRFAKCDMVCTVALGRLDFYQGHWGAARVGHLAKHTRESGKLDLETLLNIKRALAAVLEINACLFVNAGAKSEIAAIVAAEPIAS